MSRSHHVTERQRKRDKYLNRDDSGAINPALSKLDELSLKKTAAKETEAWRRDAEKAGGLRHTKFTFGQDGLDVSKQERRGTLSDIPGAVITKKKKNA